MDEATESGGWQTEPAPRRLEWTPELVERFWDGVARTRLVESSFSRTGGLSLLVAIDHLLASHARILDFGAGDGDMVRAMCERGLQAAAYEPSGQRTANLRANLEGVPGFLGVFGPRSEAEFDVVTLTEVIEHILEPDLDAVLARVASLVRPGGLLVVTTPHQEDLDLSMAYCPVSNLLFHRWQHVRAFTPESLEALLGRYGFRKRAIHCLGFSDAFFRPFDSQSSEALPESEWPDFMRNLRADREVRIPPETTILYLGERMR